MGVLDNTKFILKVCELFYLKGMSQKEISAHLGISRLQVSRIIAVANEKKLVTIHLNYDNVQENALQNQLFEKYGIDHSNIIKCCKGKQGFAGRHLITGEKLHWVYADETNNSSVA